MDARCLKDGNGVENNFLMGTSLPLDDDSILEPGRGHCYTKI